MRGLEILAFANKEYITIKHFKGKRWNKKLSKKQEYIKQQGVLENYPNKTSKYKKCEC